MWGSKYISLLEGSSAFYRIRELPALFIVIKFIIIFVEPYQQDFYTITIVNRASAYRPGDARGASLALDRIRLATSG